MPNPHDLAAQRLNDVFGHFDRIAGLYIAVGVRAARLVRGFAIMQDTVSAFWINTIFDQGVMGGFSLGCGNMETRERR